MKVVITGGTGFVGLALARSLLNRDSIAGPDGVASPIDRMVLFDAVVPGTPPAGLDHRVSVLAGDIADRDTVMSLIDQDDIAVFHLASVVSGGGEKDFDLALRVNLDGARNVFEACRRLGSGPRVVFASSLAVFGGAAMPKTVGDMVKQLPQTSYGATKAIGELLINDYTRKGFLDGRAARLPTVIIRPGKPNLALSGFASGIFREPLAGVDFVCPVRPETILPVIGARAAVAGFVALYQAAGAALGEDRAVTLPSLAVTVSDMLASLERVGGSGARHRVGFKLDPLAQKVCDGWPHATDHARALALGLASDRALDDIVRQYLEDYADTTTG